MNEIRAVAISVGLVTMLITFGFTFVMAKGIAYMEFIEKHGDLISKIKGLEKDNAYAKTIIQDLLDNSDEYARQRAMDFVKKIE